MTATDGRASRQLLSRADRHAQLLRAAATAFARAGFAATSMEDVAAEAGVTRLIVYRHFDSKEDLYRAVLTATAGRLGDEFVRGLNATGGERDGFTTRSMLTVAREDPDGFRLLMLHAAREPAFAELHQEFRETRLAVAATLIGDAIDDPVTKAWAARSFVDYLVQGVLAWLEVGDPARDDEFVGLATAGLRSLFLTWASPEPAPGRSGARP